jgi:hypothetical protein
MRILGIVALTVTLAGRAIQRISKKIWREIPVMRWVVAVLLVGWSTTALAQLDIAPPDQKGGAQKKNIGNEMGVLSKD